VPVPEWTAEREVDLRLAVALIAEQFPGLAQLPVRPLGSGWDNAVFGVGDGPPAWAFRFPQRAIAVPGVEREIALLGKLAGALPLPIPDPTWVGRPSVRHDYPWPFFGTSFIDGVEVADAAPSDEVRASLAAPLGRFLRALHDPELARRLGARLPVDPNRRTDMPYRAQMTEGRLRELAHAGLWGAPPSARHLLDEARSLPPVEGGVIVHGDLHVRHLLLHDDRPAGVIDWGDMGYADASVDLALVWYLLPPAGRERFFDAYGPINPAQRTRARLLGLLLSATLALYAVERGMDALRRETVDALDRTLAD